MEDSTIIEQLRQGNKKAYEEMYKKYYVSLFNYSHSFLQNMDDAKDVLQNCFLQICNRPALWVNITDLRGYLYSMVRRQSLYHIRSRESTHLKEDSYIYYYLTAMPNQTPEALNTIEHRESGSRINRLLSYLSPQRSLIFQMVYFDKKSYQQAAEILGVSRETVKTQLTLARSILRGKCELITLFTGISILIPY